ncbi:MAG: tetratricopeptide repeat protein, partial [Planctomycetota bacterium]
MDELTERLMVGFQRNPDDSDAFKALSEHLFFKASWKPYVDVCAEWAGSLQDSMEAARLYAKAASIAEDKLRDPGRAEELYKAALDLEGEFRPALLGLRQVLGSVGKYPELVEVLRHEARLSSPVERPLLFMEAGKVLETQVGDIPKAIEFYRQVHDLQPANIKAIDALEKNFRALSRWEDLRELLEGIVASTPPPELHAKVLFKLGKLYESQFSDTVRATRCLEMVRDLKPGVASVYKDLARLYEGQKNWAALVRILESEAKLDLPPGERSRILKTAGEISVEKLGDTAAATRFFDRAAELAPESFEAEEEEDTPPEPLRDETLIRLETAVEGAGSPAEKVDRILDLARHLLKEGRDTKDAAAWVERALEIGPSGRDQWRELLACAADSGTGPEASEGLAAVAGQTESGGDAAALLVMLGEFRIDQLGDKTGAIQAFQGALKRNPHDQAAVSQLEKHWEEMGHTEGLTSLFRWQAAKAPDGETRSIARRKLTRVLKRDPGKLTEATHLLHAAFMENPEDPQALEDYVQTMNDQGNHSELATALAQANETTPTTAIRLHLAQSYLKIDKVLEGVDILENLHHENPTDSELLSMLNAALDSLGDHDRKAGILAERIRAMDNFEEKLEALLELGTHYIEKVQSPPEAVAVYEDALTIDPANEEALDALERVFFDSEQWSGLVEVLERRAAFALDNEQSASVYLRIGEIWGGKLSELEPAAAAFEKASTLDPNNPLLLEKLEEAYAGLGDWAGLVRILLRTREATTEPDEAIRCLAKAAEVYEKNLGDMDKARKFFGDVLDTRPDHVPALRGMQRIHRAAGDDGALAETLLLEAAVTQATEARA